jgi:hypothetical protein
MNAYRVVITVYADQEAADATDAVDRVIQNLGLPDDMPYRDAVVFPAVQGFNKQSPLLPTSVTGAKVVVVYEKSV